MNIEIDQSRKIEETQGDTIVAFSNGMSYALRIKAQDKRKLQQLFRESGKPRMYIYQTFSVLLFLLVRKFLVDIREIVIDTEYTQHEDLIKRELLVLIREEIPLFSKDAISFAYIGKKSNAHKIAYAVFQGKRNEDKTVTFEEIVSLLVKRMKK